MKLPYVLPLESQEVLSSWCRRIECYYETRDIFSNPILEAKEQFLSEQGAPPVHPLNLLDINPDDVLLNLVSERTGAGIEELRKLTWQAQHPEFEDFMVKGQVYQNRTKNDHIIESRPSHCPSCLKEQIKQKGWAYIVRRWLYSFNIVCSKHKTYLIDGCTHRTQSQFRQHWHRPLTYNFQDSIPNSLNCRICGQPASDHPTSRVNTLDLKDLETFRDLMLCLKRNNLTEKLGGPGDREQINNLIKDFINMWFNQNGLFSYDEKYKNLQNHALSIFVKKTNIRNFSELSNIWSRNFLLAFFKNMNDKKARENPFDKLRNHPNLNFVWLMKENQIPSIYIPLISYYRWPAGYRYHLQNSKTDTHEKIKIDLDNQYTAMDTILESMDRKSETKLVKMKRAKQYIDIANHALLSLFD